MSAGQELARLRWATPQLVLEGDSFGARAQTRPPAQGPDPEQLVDRVGASSKGRRSAATKAISRATGQDVGDDRGVWRGISRRSDELSKTTCAFIFTQIVFSHKVEQRSRPARSDAHGRKPHCPGGSNSRRATAGWKSSAEFCITMPRSSCWPAAMRMPAWRSRGRFWYQIGILHADFRQASGGEDLRPSPHLS